MITLTKEWLMKTIAELEEERDATPGAVNEDAANALAAMKLALASLEAESVAFRSKLKPPSSIGSDHWDYTDHRQPDAFELESCVIERLYTAPPAPVSVPEPIKRNDADGWWMYKGRRVGGGCAEWYNLALDDCRAAMLQGADGNALVSPDGWVACIERMPDIDTEIFYFCKDDGLRDCGIVSTSNFSGRGDAQLYVHAEGYDLRLGVDITHWMPLPAAPQQGDSF